MVQKIFISSSQSRLIENWTKLNTTEEEGGRKNKTRQEHRPVAPCKWTLMKLVHKPK